MIKNYIKIGWRSFIKNKVPSFINIFGLSIGFIILILIGLWINNEFSYNNHFKNKNKIAKIYQNQTRNTIITTSSKIPMGLEYKLQEEYSNDIKYIVMSSIYHSEDLKYKNKTISLGGYFIQKDAPEIFDLNIIEGVKNGLNQKNSIMLSESTAKTLFGSENPIGKIIKYDNKYNMLVTGIFKNIPVNNDFSNTQFFMPWKQYIDAKWDWLKNPRNDWTQDDFLLFIQFKEQTGIQYFNKKISNISSNYSSKENPNYNSQFFALPMKDWYLNSNFENGLQTGGRIENVYLFGYIGLLIILLATINFINLSTVFSEKRILEIGIRKAIGATRKQLINQFICESFLIVFSAYIIALLVTLIVIPEFNTLAKKDISFPWNEYQFWIISLLLILLITLFSASYPALYLSSFRPVNALKKIVKTGTFSVLPRKILVITQFIISVTLIICTLVINQQIQYSKNRPLGYNTIGLIQIPFFGKSIETVRKAFMSSGAVTQISWSSNPTTEIWQNNTQFNWEGKSADFQENFARTGISYDYFKSLGMKVIEGREFSRKFASDSNAVILNKQAVAYIGMNNPIGKMIHNIDEDYPQAPQKIIGIVDDMVIQSPYESIKPHIYEFAWGTAGFYNLRLNTENSIKENLQIIENVSKNLAPNFIFRYDFVDQKYAQKFVTEERLANLIKIFTTLAIFICCLGLFGMISFIVEQRTKEIGIRKILGASAKKLWILLSKDFITLVGISLLIASPVAYYLMSQWLQKFPYRTDISFTTFLIAGFGALLITFITISIQAIRTITANPVNSLRTE